MKTKTILLGDNPFFGIDHLSQERMRQKVNHSNNFNKIIQVIEFVNQLGVNGFVVSTHPQLKDLINYMKTNTQLLKTLTFYPILPYVQGYVSKITEKGMVETFNDVLYGTSTYEKLKIFYRGSVGFVLKDFKKILKTFIDIELLPLYDVKKDTIFLHNVFTDLAISLGMREIIETFVDHIKSQYGLRSGFVTKNLPMLVSTLKKWDLEHSIAMASFNPIGYQMNPSREECEKCLAANNIPVIGMNVLAGGFLKLEDSARYISKQNLDSVVIGMSTLEHANETISIFRKLWTDVS